MSYLRHTVLTLSVAAVSCGAGAQTAAEHKQHHPATSSSEAPKTASAKSMPKETMGAMDDKMKAMRDMHEKILNAKTPEERNALMADHMKAMQDGMAMMSSMCGMPADMAEHHQMMVKCMEMMSTMMPMMMDRLPAPALPTK